MSDFEVIIVDDGNTEDYRKIYKHPLFKDSRISIYFEKNKGVSAARNFGVEYAKGEYIAFVDSDDILHERYLLEAYNIAKKCNADFVIGGTVFLDQFESVKHRDDGEFPVTIYKGIQIRELFKYMVGRKRYEFKSGLGKIDHGPWARLVRREIAQNVKFDIDLPIGEDVVWNFEVLNRSDTVCVAEAIWYGYYFNPVSSSRRYRENAICESENSLRKIKEYLCFDDDDEYYAFCSRCVTDLYRIHKCFLGNTDSRLSKDDKSKSLKELYSEEPWIEIASKRFYRLCRAKEKVSCLLYRYKLLFFYYDFRSRIFGS